MSTTFPPHPWFPLGLLASLMGACASPPEVSVTSAAPALVLESFFPGRTVGEGTFTNSWTGAQRRFDVVIEGTWDGRTLTLVEDFAFADGALGFLERLPTFSGEMLPQGW